MRRGFFPQALFLLGIACLPAICQAVFYGASAPWQKPAVREGEVELAQVEAWGANVMWVDARPEAQFQERHIPGAILLNEDRWNELLPAFLQQWSPEKQIVVYCSSQSCAASHDVARRLQEEAGLPKETIHVLHGGWEAWLAANR